MTPPAKPADWRGRRVTVWGLGRFGGGVGIARWLAGQGADVLVTDQADADDLAGPLAELRDVPIRLRLGEHREEDFTDCDAVVVNPAIPEHAPLLRTARDAGTHLTTEINEFVLRCPARVIGVTGTVGKSTTCAMLAELLDDGRNGRVWLGGNVGRSLLADLPAIGADDVVVLELSSFQLQRTAWVRWSPQVALLTNVAPNHLDWHGGFAAYLAAKLNIVRFQDPADGAIVTHDDPQLCHVFDQLFGDLAGVWRFRLDEDGTPRARCQSTSAVESPDRFAAWPDLRLSIPGPHNRLNAAAALTAAHASDPQGPLDASRLERFAGLADRLERIGAVAGVTWFNDSKASTPEAALTALAAFDAPPLMIVGGYDKGVPLDSFAERLAADAGFVACIGRTGPNLHEAITTRGGRAELCETLDRAVERCRAEARPGDVVLLSPGCASWDQFVDYRARGARFRALVMGDA